MDNHISWELTDIDEVDLGIDEVEHILDDENDFVYDYDMIRCVEYSLESSNGFVVSGTKLFVPEITDGGDEDSVPLSYDEIVPEFVPDDVAVRIVVVTSLYVTSLMSSDEYNLVEVAAYGARSDDAVAESIDGFVNYLVDADDDVAVELADEIEGVVLRDDKD